MPVLSNPKHDLLLPEVGVDTALGQILLGLTAFDPVTFPGVYKGETLTTEKAKELLETTRQKRG